MKIGVVCDLTKLSDRTVRYYIEEGLLAPDCRKNYMGRKSFDFSEGDVATLQDIAVLRKYGFSVENIRTIMESPEMIWPMVSQLQEEKRQIQQKEQRQLTALEQLDRDKDYTMAELAQSLRYAELDETRFREEFEDYMLAQAFRFWFWCIFIPALLIIAGETISLIWEWSEKLLYVKFYPDLTAFVNCVLMLAVPVVLAAAMLLVSGKKLRRRKKLYVILTGVLFALCVLFVPYCTFVGGVDLEMYPPLYSETEDPDHYLCFGEIEQEHPDIYRLFPSAIPESAMAGENRLRPDSTRYYNKTTSQWDDYFEVLAQWQLSQDQLESEKERILTAFSGEKPSVTQKGEWTYWRFSGADPWTMDDANQEYSSNYCVAFAYRQDTGLVRYIVASVAWDDTPAFLSMDWS